MELIIQLGEQTGIMSVLDICTPQQQSQRHFLIPSNVSMKSLSNEDREYLRAKGVFSFPGKDACNHLLYAYFHHVHPIMPVVDASVVLEYHRQDRLYEYNLSLLWSMFFVAVNVCPPIPRAGILANQTPYSSFQRISGSLKAMLLRKI